MTGADRTGGAQDLRSAAHGAAARGDLAGAIALFERLVAQPSAAHDEDRIALVDVLVEARRFGQAEVALRGFLAEAPANRELRLHLAVLLQRMDRWGACCEALRDLAAEPQPPPLAIFLLALHQRALGLLAEAVETFRRLPPGSAAYWESERKRALDAHAAAQHEAAQQQPGSPGQLDALAALGERGAFEAAVGRLDAEAQRWHAVVAGRALFALRDGGLDAAAAIYAQASASDAAPVLRIALARLLADAGRNDEAIGILEGLAEDARPGAAWAMLARLLLLRGRIGAPEGFAGQYLARFPLEREANISFVLAGLEAGVVRLFAEPAGSPPRAAPHPFVAPGIVQFWHGPPPDDVRLLMEGWQRHNPQLRHELFDEARARGFLALNFGAEIAAAFDYCHHAAMKSDVFRLAYLFLHGGVYVDADEACRRPLEPVFDALEEAECVLYLRSGVQPYINNSFIAARPQARVIGTALREVTDRLRAARASGQRTDIWHSSGPGALTRAAAAALREALGRPADASRVLRLITERHLGTYAQTADDLAYKTAPGGDWRDAVAPAAHVLTSVFAAKYEGGSDWGGHSGFGSSPPHMAPYIHFVGQFIHLNNVRSIVDIGCGDWQFSRFINMGEASYTGFDVVPGLVERNRVRYGHERVRFEMMPEDAGTLPEGDLLLIKDVLQHLPQEMVQDILRRALPRFRYALITNSYRKLDAAPVNIDITAGGFRPLDLTAPPFEVAGSYVLEFSSAFWEQLRTLLVVR